jgi:hypothetical protein
MGSFPSTINTGAPGYAKPTPFISEAGIVSNLHRPLGDDGSDCILDCPLVTDTQLLKGIGATTFSKGSSTQWVEDFEGILRPVYGEASAHHGTRVVSNLFKNSNDINAWSFVNGSGSASRVGQVLTIKNNTDYLYRANIQSNAGDVIRATISITTPPESVGKNVYFGIYTGVGSTLYNRTIVLLEGEKRYSITVTQTISGGASGVVLSSATYSSAYSFTVNQMQYEVVTGQSIQYPSEYVENTSSTYPATKCFTTTNANTVDANGVVTEAMGVPISTEMKGILLEPTRTNRVTCYNTIPGDTFGSTLASGTATIGKVYEIVARVALDWGAVGTLLSGSANTGGARYLITGTLTFTATETGKEVVLGIGTKAYYSGAFINPIINLALGGDVASTLSIVDDSANLPTTLKHLCSSGKIYKVDNSAGATASTATIGGTTGVTTATSISAWIRGGTGSIKIGAVAGQTFAASTPYTRVYQENVTPGNTVDQMVITVDAGQTVYFILPQMEVSAFITSEIVTAGATAVRNTTVLNWPTGINLVKTPGMQGANNFSLGLEFVAYGNVHANGVGDRIIQCTVNGDNYWILQLYSGLVALLDYVNSVVSVVKRSDVTIAAGFVLRVTFTVSSINGRRFKINGANATISTKRLANLPLSPTIYWANANGYLKNFRIYNKPLSDAKCAQLTTL